MGRVFVNGIEQEPAGQTMKPGPSSPRRRSCFWCNWPVAKWAYPDRKGDDTFDTCDDPDCRKQSENAVARAGGAPCTEDAIPFLPEWETLASEAGQRNLAIETRRRWASRKK